MGSFVQQIMAMPTVIFTALLGIVLVYWMFVIVGALDIDMVDVGGDLDGLAEGAAEGAVEGGVDGATEGLDGATETASGLQDGLSLLSFMSWLGLRNAPFTVVFSLIIVIAWAASFLGRQYLTGVLGPGPLTSVLVATFALLVATPLTGLMSRPLGPLFKIRAAEERRDLVGRSCTIETGSVDERFGVATVHEGGHWPRIEVRAASPNPLTRGAEALIVSYDPDEETFRVEPLASAEPTRRG